MLVCSAMESTLSKLLVRLKEKIISWRPVASELSQDYGDMYAELRRWYRRYPRRVTLLLWAALFVLGLCLGLILKSAAHSAVTIGYEDYRLKPAAQLYDLNALRQEALQDGAALPVSEKIAYPACDQSADDRLDAAE